jgi:hypothetical protein
VHQNSRLEVVSPPFCCSTMEPSRPCINGGTVGTFRTSRFDTAGFSKRVNDRRILANLRLGSRVMRRHIAPCWIKRRRRSHVVGRRSRRWEAWPSLGSFERMADQSKSTTRRAFWMAHTPSGAEWMTLLVRVMFDLECLLSRVKQTSFEDWLMSANDPGCVKTQNSEAQ